mmetsp:Transcript_6991/g.24868  ORF Transcript_6991/g.24868 Transcript_6991/m.24868 type:complete len:635 (-) Transcript_6991:58-1962(-)
MSGKAIGVGAGFLAAAAVLGGLAWFFSNGSSKREGEGGGARSKRGDASDASTSSPLGSFDGGAASGGAGGGGGAPSALGDEVTYCDVASSVVRRGAFNKLQWGSPCVERSPEPASTFKSVKFALLANTELTGADELRNIPVLGGVEHLARHGHKAAMHAMTCVSSVAKVICCTRDGYDELGSAVFVRDVDGTTKAWTALHILSTNAEVVDGAKIQLVCQWPFHGHFVSRLVDVVGVSVVESLDVAVLTLPHGCDAIPLPLIDAESPIDADVGELVLAIHWASGVQQVSGGTAALRNGIDADLLLDAGLGASGAPVLCYRRGEMCIAGLLVGREPSRFNIVRTFTPTTHITDAVIKSVARVPRWTGDSDFAYCAAHLPERCVVHAVDVDGRLVKVPVEGGACDSLLCAALEGGGKRRKTRHGAHHGTSTRDVIRAQAEARRARREAEFDSCRTSHVRAHRHFCPEEENKHACPSNCSTDSPPRTVGRKSRLVPPHSGMSTQCFHSRVLYEARVRGTEVRGRDGKISMVLADMSGSSLLSGGIIGWSCGRRTTWVQVNCANEIRTEDDLCGSHESNEHVFPVWYEGEVVVRLSSSRTRSLPAAVQAAGYAAIAWANSACVGDSRCNGCDVQEAPHP